MPKRVVRSPPRSRAPPSSATTWGPAGPARRVRRPSPACAAWAVAPLVLLVSAAGAASEPPPATFTVRMLGEAAYPTAGPFIPLDCTPGPTAGPVLPTSPPLHLDGCYFDPPVLEIRAGDSVTFTAATWATSHKAGSPPPHPGAPWFDTGPLEPGQSRTIPFPVAATYDYECALHRETMSRGRLVVRA